MKNRPETPWLSGEKPIDPFLLSHFRTCTEPLTLRRDGKPVHWQDETRHRSAFASDPELYSLHAFAEQMQPWQQARMLLVLLTSSRRTMPGALLPLLESVTLFLLTALPTELVLTVFLAARRARANHRHTARTMLSYLLHHPQIETLACARPGVIRDCLEHALGKGMARHFGLYGPREGRERPLPAPLRRYGGAETQIRRLFDLLYFRGSPQESTRAAAPNLHRASEAADPERLTPLLLHLYRVGSSPEWVQRLEKVVADRAAELPDLPGRIALLLDASASMRGASPRDFAPIALAVGFERILQARCAGLRTYTVGGFGWPPAPEGPTDFGRVLIDALEAEPELLVIVTDGYENLNRGDTARIQATLRQMGRAIPLVCCHIMAGIEPERAHTMGLPSFPLQSERGFEVAIQIMGMLAAPQAVRERLVEWLRGRRERWETEVYAWTVAS